MGNTPLLGHYRKSMPRALALGGVLFLVSDVPLYRLKKAKERIPVSCQEQACARPTVAYAPTRPALFILHCTGVPRS